MSDAATLPTSVREAVLDEIWEGLNRPVPELSPRFFYDRRGSELFEQITRLDEYYPTRTETALLERWAGPMMERLRPAALLELGAGSARKTRILLKAMEELLEGGRFIPVDVSGDFLKDVARELERDFPHIHVVPEVADFTAPFQLAHPLPHPVLVALLGGTIGNFTPDAAVRLLGSIAARMTNDGDRFLLGVDLRPGSGKTKAELEAAYDDALGVTAEFNRNMLRVVNRLVGADFLPERWCHHAFYSEEHGRIEMHLIAEGAQTVVLPERGRIDFAAGAGIRTEISAKYDRPSVDALFARAGMRVTDWLTDSRERYALVLGAHA